MHKIQMLFIVFLSLFFVGSAFSSEVNACNTELIAAVGDYLKIPNFSSFRSENGGAPTFNDGTELIIAKCKIWPYDPKNIIAIFSYYTEDTPINSDSYWQHMNFFVGIIRISDNHILSAYKWIGFHRLGSSIGNLEIDTARYDMAPGKRAFGIDIEDGYAPSTVGGGSGPTRTLFIQDGENILPVLKEFSLSKWNYVDESVVSTQPDGDKSIQTFKYSIGIGKTSTNGFRDLEISESLTYEIEEGSKYKGLKNSKKISKVLHFNGKEYQ